MSERRNPFLGFEQIRGAAPNTKVGAAGAKLVGMLESEAFFGDRVGLFKIPCFAS